MLEGFLGLIGVYCGFRAKCCDLRALQKWRLQVYFCNFTLRFDVSWRWCIWESGVSNEISRLRMDLWKVLVWFIFVIENWNKIRNDLDFFPTNLILSIIRKLCFMTSIYSLIVQFGFAGCRQWWLFSLNWDKEPAKGLWDPLRSSLSIYSIVVLFHHYDSSGREGLVHN